jgi:hypothetical protein
MPKWFKAIPASVHTWIKTNCCMHLAALKTFNLCRGHIWPYHCREIQPVPAPRVRGKLGVQWLTILQPHILLG